MTIDQKTLPGPEDVEAYLETVKQPRRREDAKAALALLRRVTGVEPRLWAGSMVGFGQYAYRYDSGREGISFRSGFAPRSTSLVFYVMGGVPDDDPLYDRLGPVKKGKSCVYVKRLDAVDLGALEAILVKSWAYMAETYPDDRPSPA